MTATYAKEWRIKNPEKQKAITDRYRQKHLDQIQKKQQEYYESHRDRQIALARINQYRKRGVGNKEEIERLIQIYIA